MCFAMTGNGEFLLEQLILTSHLESASSAHRTTRWADDSRRGNSNASVRTRVELITVGGEGDVQVVCSCRRNAKMPYPTTPVLAPQVVFQ